jgi:hypothetical protein
MLYRFQAEWAVKRGVQFTARNNEFSGRLIEDSPEMMEEHRKILRQYSRK